MRTALWLAFAAVLSMVAGCETDSNIDAPRKFFSKNKIGVSADYAVIKWGNPDDHSVTVHGFLDDQEGCRLIAEALNKDACNETGGRDCLNPFSCQLLNQ